MIWSPISTGKDHERHEVPATHRLVDCAHALATTPTGRIIMGRRDLARTPGRNRHDQILGGGHFGIAFGAELPFGHDILVLVRLDLILRHACHQAALLEIGATRRSSELASK